MVDETLMISALKKLMDHTASGIGAVAGPLIARLTAPAKAGALRIEAGAEADAMRIRAGGVADSMALIAEGTRKSRESLEPGGLSTTGQVSIGDEINARLEFQEEKRQRNIETVVRMAAQDLKDTEVADHEVDHDWTARFFADVQDITSEEMQRIWARILAGEVETPGRTSLHTLNILKNMSQRDAELFVAAAQFVFDDCILGPDLVESIPHYPSVENLLRLDSYGLISYGSLQVIIETPASPTYIVCNVNKNLRIYYRCSGNQEHKEIKFPAYPLTPQGKELYDVVGISSNKYAEQALARYVRKEYDLTLESFEMHLYNDKMIIFGMDTFPRHEASFRIDDPRLPWAPVPLGGSSNEDAGS